MHFVKINDISICGKSQTEKVYGSVIDWTFLFWEN